MFERKIYQTIAPTILFLIFINTFEGKVEKNHKKFQIHWRFLVLKSETKTSERKHRGLDKNQLWHPTYLGSFKPHWKSNCQCLHSVTKHDGFKNGQNLQINENFLFQSQPNHQSPKDQFKQLHILITKTTVSQLVHFGRNSRERKQRSQMAVKTNKQKMALKSQKSRSKFKSALFKEITTRQRIASTLDQV